MHATLLLYVMVLVAANLLVAAIGPAFAPVGAFVFIGLDLALRDWLHMRMRPWHIAALILVAGTVSWCLNPAAGRIAAASAVAFTAASIADWALFAALRGRWVTRSLASNVAGAAVDSALFPLLAFGAVLPEIIALQFAAKVAGAALWTAIFARVRACASS